MGRRVSAGEEETTERHITSASHMHGRTASTKIPRKMENRMPTRFGPKSELGCRFDFKFYFKDLSLKSKDSNTFKPNLN
jgi:hypothetical protein